jgi:hypothetical protein
MFEVRDHQFLVLLFVMQAKRNDGCQHCQLPLINLLQQRKLFSLTKDMSPG